MKLLITDDPKVLIHHLKTKGGRAIRPTNASALQNYCSWEMEVAEAITDPNIREAVHILCQRSFTHWDNPALFGAPDWLAFVTMTGFRIEVQEVIDIRDV